MTRQPYKMDDIYRASPGSIFDAQKTSEQTARQVLKAMKQDLAEDKEWARKNIDATLELLDSYTQRR